MTTARRYAVTFFKSQKMGMSTEEIKVDVWAYTAEDAMTQVGAKHDDGSPDLCFSIVGVEPHASCLPPDAKI